jgi:hypothetical protein
MKKNRFHASGERRCNIERRRIVYTAHIPERRTGRERRCPPMRSASAPSASHPED